MMERCNPPIYPVRFHSEYFRVDRSERRLYTGLGLWMPLEAFLDKIMTCHKARKGPHQKATGREEQVGRYCAERIAFK